MCQRSSPLHHCITMHGWNKLLKFIAKATELIAAELQILPYHRNYRFLIEKCASVFVRWIIELSYAPGMQL